MQVQVSRNLRLNKAKISEVSSTSADYGKMGDIWSPATICSAA
jgi:hypothetical protein